MYLNHSILLTRQGSAVLSLSILGIPRISIPYYSVLRKGLQLKSTENSASSMARNRWILLQDYDSAFSLQKKISKEIQKDVNSSQLTVFHQSRQLADDRKLHYYIV